MLKTASHTQNVSIAIDIQRQLGTPHGVPHYAIYVTDNFVKNGE